jgi:hypothetical protein
VDHGVAAASSFSWLKPPVDEGSLFENVNTPHDHAARPRLG